jgi:hypothetical protein
MKGHEMRRFLGLPALAAAAVTAGVAVLAVLPAGTAVAASGAPSAVQCRQLAIRSLTFDPAVANPGQVVTATVVARNCSRMTLRTTLQWTARFVGTTAGIPAGCPAIDPLPVAVAFPPRRSVSSSLGVLIFPACTATSLEVTARYTDSAGTVLDQRTASVPIVAAG